MLSSFLITCRVLPAALATFTSAFDHRRRSSLHPERYLRCSISRKLNRLVSCSSIHGTSDADMEADGLVASVPTKAWSSLSEGLIPAHSISSSVSLVTCIELCLDIDLRSRNWPSLLLLLFEEPLKVETMYLRTKARRAGRQARMIESWSSSWAQKYLSFTHQLRVHPQTWI